MSRVHSSAGRSSHHSSKTKASKFPTEMLYSIANPARLRDSGSENDIEEEPEDVEVQEAQAVEPQQHSFDDFDAPDVHASTYSHAPDQQQPSRSSRHNDRRSRSRASGRADLHQQPVSIKVSRPLPPPVQVEEQFYDNDDAGESDRSHRHRYTNRSPVARRRHDRSRRRQHRSSRRRREEYSTDESAADDAVEEAAASIPPLYSDRQREQHERDIRSAVQDFGQFRAQNLRDDEQLEKQELLYRIQQLNRDGYTCSKPMNEHAEIDEVRYELYRMSRELNRDKTLKWYSQSLITACRMLEMANKKFDPFSLRLDGFSRAVTLNIDDYQPSLLSIHNQYGGRTASTNPVVQLFMTLIGSLMFHHVSVVTSEEAQREKPLSSTGKVISSLAGANANAGAVRGTSSNASSNPFSMLTGIFGAKPKATTAAVTGTTTTTVPVAPMAPKMQGPPDDDSASDM